MGSINRQFLIIALSMWTNCISCSPIENVNIDVTTPCNDVTEAMDRLYGSLLDQMPLVARCKRYSVLLSMIETTDVTYQLALLQVAALEDNILDRLYDEIKVVDLAFRYMTTINIYRASHLGQAFIDLIECLKGFELPLVKEYLNDPELVMIADLYKRALGPPAIVIDLDSIDLKAFRPEFRTNLEKLFETIGQVPKQDSNQIELFNQLSPSYLPQLKLAEQFITSTVRRLRLKDMKRERQRRFRARRSARIRKKQQRELSRGEHESNGLLEPKQRSEGPPDGPSVELQLLRVRERERRRRQRRQRQLEERLSILQASPGAAIGGTAPTVRVCQGQKQQQAGSGPALSSPGEPALRPITIESSSAKLQGDRPVSGSKEHASGRQYPEELTCPLERRRYLQRERQRRYRERNSQRLRTEDRERKRRCRQ